MRRTFSVKVDQPRRPCKACEGTGKAHKFERGELCRIYPFTACKVCGGLGSVPADKAAS